MEFAFSMARLTHCGRGIEKNSLTPEGTKRMLEARVCFAIAHKAFLCRLLIIPDGEVK
jgi:hypothetical protein